MQTPSVGRIVHFHRSDEANGLRCEAAIVTRVNQNGTVNLAIFSAHENAELPVYRASSVHGADGPTAECWTWPPRV